MLENKTKIEWFKLIVKSTDDLDNHNILRNIAHHTKGYSGIDNTLIEKAFKTYNKACVIWWGIYFSFLGFCVYNGYLSDDHGYIPIMIIAGITLLFITANMGFNEGLLKKIQTDILFKILKDQFPKVFKEIETLSDKRKINVLSHALYKVEELNVVNDNLEEFIHGVVIKRKRKYAKEIEKRDSEVSEYVNLSKEANQDGE